MNLRRLWVETGLALLVWRRYSTQMLMGFVMPIMFLLLLGWTAGLSEPEPFYLVDEDRSPESAALVASLEALGLEPLAPHAEIAFDQAEDWMGAQAAGNLAWIPEGFGATVRDYSGGNESVPVVTVIRAGVSRDAPSAIAAMVEASVVRQLESQAAGARLPTVQVLTTGDAPPAYLDFLFPGMIGLGMLSVGLFGAVGAVASARSLGVLSKMQTTPLTRAEWMAARMVSQILITHLAVMAVVIVGWLAFGLFLPVTPLTVATAVTGALALSGIGVLLAGWLRDPAMASLVSNLVYIPMMFFSGTFFPISSMPSWAANITQGLPLTHVTAGLRSAGTPGEEAAAAVSALILLCFAIVSIGLGSRLIDWGDH